MPEIRFEAGDQDVAVLDWYCSARGKCGTEWSQAKLHEATLIVRVAGINPTISEDSRK